METSQKKEFVVVKYRKPGTKRAPKMRLVTKEVLIKMLVLMMTMILPLNKSMKTKLLNHKNKNKQWELVMIVLIHLLAACSSSDSFLNEDEDHGEEMEAKNYVKDFMHRLTQKNVILLKQHVKETC